MFWVYLKISLNVYIEDSRHTTVQEIFYKTVLLTSQKHKAN